MKLRLHERRIFKDPLRRRFFQGTFEGRFFMHQLIEHFLCVHAALFKFTGQVEKQMSFESLVFQRGRIVLPSLGYQLSDFPWCIFRERSFLGGAH